MITTHITQYAQQPTESNYSIDEIISFTLQHECVLGARAFEWNGNIVVAALTAPFYLKSERDNAKNLITESLQDVFNDKNFILTFDMQVYRNINDKMDDLAKQQLTELAKSR